MPTSDPIDASSVNSAIQSLARFRTRWLEDRSRRIAAYQRPFVLSGEPPALSWCSVKGHVRKLVVNSTVGGQAGQRCVLASLAAAGFSQWQDVVLVLGNSNRNGVALQTIGNLVAPTGASAAAAAGPGVPLEAGPEADHLVLFGRMSLQEVADKRLVVLETTRHDFDYHGFAAISAWRDDPLVAADSYLYVHDTCVVNERFPAAFGTLHASQPGCIVLAPPPSSNICLFDRVVLERFGSNFEGARPLTKAEAIDIEDSFMRANVRPLAAFGRLVLCDCRTRTLAVYGGQTRYRCNYAALGVIKYVNAHDGVRQAEFLASAPRCEGNEHSPACPRVAVAQLSRKTRSSETFSS